MVRARQMDYVAQFGRRVIPESQGPIVAFFAAVPD
jgi:hypothetical protein